ncbi:hypothetical protein COCMIDRAFT_79480 [Bipolaris oryzae ATCC 44560]|uniref:Short-chain dehydrogenase/reductase 3 n=1 Tax=Bipolaris oryzae ATCC 44560 TaxID=930090 RepID=W7A526_COCMI|nr:uncharacterized protein COCMIDRAFT_79480 [Bipolaris oryzae ATCC 44560]EUC51196.1 hypothetical protein COCMIDRAFT_79480 [Bipolaris oryzae ATCC 44560]
MPIRSEWSLAREGITRDTLVNLLKLTAFNPALTLPIFLLARYTQQGSSLASQHSNAFKHLKTLLGLGLFNTASTWLSNRTINNWTSDKYDWDREVVVVTGGSDGIGKIVVQLLAEKGIKVAVLDVQDLTYEAPPSVSFFKCDLSSPKAIAETASSIRAALGNPTILINNAGVARGKNILESTEKDINLTFRVNAMSHYYLAQQFLPHMISTNHGMIVTVASIAAYVPAPNMVDYCSSKAAALTFHEGLSAELVNTYKAPKVRTVAVCQGYTRTALFEGFNPNGALYPETVAEAIVKAVLSGKSQHVVLPENVWGVLPKLRGFPLWMQYGVRKRLGGLMKDWKGRQVVQPSEVGEEGGEKKVDESTVFVGKE